MIDNITRYTLLSQISCHHHHIKFKVRKDLSEGFLGVFSCGLKVNAFGWISCYFSVGWNSCHSFYVANLQYSTL
jgi:hypothetical protein